MERAFVIISAAFLCVGCGSDPSPRRSSAPTQPSAPTAPAPIPGANITVPAEAVFDVPGCQVLRTLNAAVGLPTTTCLTFTGVLRNAGSGCASNVRGTTRISSDAGSVTGVGSWSYAGNVRPNEQFVYSGGPITVPSGNSGFRYQTTPSWDNIRC